MNVSEKSPVEFTLSSDPPQRLLEISSPVFNDITQMYHSEITRSVMKDGVWVKESIGFICSKQDVGIYKITQELMEVGRKIAANLVPNQ